MIDAWRDMPGGYSPYDKRIFPSHRHWRLTLQLSDPGLEQLILLEEQLILRFHLEILTLSHHAIGFETAGIGAEDLPRPVSVETLGTMLTLVVDASDSLRVTLFETGLYSFKVK